MRKHQQPEYDSGKWYYVSYGVIKTFLYLQD